MLTGAKRCSDDLIGRSIDDLHNDFWETSTYCLTKQQTLIILNYILTTMPLYAPIWMRWIVRLQCLRCRTQRLLVPISSELIYSSDFPGAAIAGWMRKINLQEENTMLKLKKIMAVVLTLITVMSVLTVVAYGVGSNDFDTFDFTLRVAGQYSYTNTISKQNGELVKFYPIKSTLSDPFVYIRARVLGTNSSSSTGGDNVTMSNSGVLVPYLTYQVGDYYSIAIVNNVYSKVYMGVSSDNTEISPYSVEGIWGYGTISLR